MKVHRNGVLLECVLGDITRCVTDAVVNPANGALIMGGGVAGAVRRAGGETIQEECMGQAPVECGGTAVTGGGRLDAKWVIHAVGPTGYRADREEKMILCAENIVKRAMELGVRSIAVPAISTGIFNYPAEEAVPVMIRGFIDAVARGHGTLEHICFVAVDKRMEEIFERTLKKTS